jgi:hypothetical protein
MKCKATVATLLLVRDNEHLRSAYRRGTILLFLLLKTKLMKEESKKIKEPYDPGKTPEPPQRVDPNVGRQKEGEVKNKQSEKKPEKKTDEKEENSHLLNDNAQINDETTI